MFSVVTLLRSAAMCGPSADVDGRSVPRLVGNSSAARRRGDGPGFDRGRHDHRVLTGEKTAKHAPASMAPGSAVIFMLLGTCVALEMDGGCGREICRRLVARSPRQRD